MTTQLLTIQQVQKQYASKQIGPIELSVESGIISGLVGPNGSGKSTILQMISGAEHRDHGEIQIFKKPIANLDQVDRQRIVYVPSKYQGLPHWKGKDLMSWYQHWYPRWNQEKMEEFISVFDLELDTPYEKLSTGNQQKLLISLALSTNADLLLLDEPSNGLDFMAKTTLYQAIQNWIEDGQRSILIASHNVEEINKLMDHITLIHHGKQIDSFWKDERVGQWGSIWIPNLPNIPVPKEVISSEQSGMTQWITQDLKKTRTMLETEQIAYQHTVLQIHEILEWMYKLNTFISK